MEEARRNNGEVERMKRDKKAVMGRKKQMVRTIILNRRSKEKESIEEDDEE